MRRPRCSALRPALAWQALSQQIDEPLHGKSRSVQDHRERARVNRGMSGHNHLGHRVITTKDDVAALLSVDAETGAPECGDHFLVRKPAR